MISRKALLMIGSALLLAACHQTTETNSTTVDTNVADTGNAADNAMMSDSAANDSNAMMSDDSDNGERSNTDTRGGGH
jgi:ABC-type glycerol-3-phosphate transport system substrate-binding protein